MMTYVVTENCILCKSTDCVEVCPVDCFHEGPNFLAIDPDECIHCGVCEPECPQKAIFSDTELPESFQKYVEINERLAKKWPVINEIKDPLPDCDKWDGVKDKLQYLDESVGEPIEACLEE